MAKTNGYLLDTQIFLWWETDDQRLPQQVKNILVDPGQLLYLSLASVWEIVIKQQIGKLKLIADLSKIIKQSYFPLLAIELNHILALNEIQNHHKDPFDRLLISQSQTENLTLITSDKKIAKYDINTLLI
jgi:PIN domain nuclease of toxin-antitoxin system